jgi:aminopeptidase N
MKKNIANKNPVIGHFGVNHIHYNIGDMYGKGALFLNTLRHVIGNDSLWFEILKGIPRDFKYQNIGTEQILTYFNQKTGKELRPVFDQYLRLTEVPVLEIHFQKNENDLALRYRWQSQVEDFNMPVSFSDRAGVERWIVPVSSWQTMALDSVGMEEIKFLTDRFYIEIKQD